MVAKGIFVWQEVTEERGNHFLQHCRRWAVQLTYIQGRGAWCLPHVWRTWVEDVLGRVDMWVGGVPMTDWHVPIATVGDSPSPFTTPVTTILSNKEDEVTQLWTVQPDDNRQTWGDIQEAVERRGLPTRVLIGYPKQRQALICDVMRVCGNSWCMWVAYQGVPFVNRPFESDIHGTVNFTQFCCVLLVTWCYRVLLSCYLRPK